MNNPARHNLDDVTLRAEDGQLVIEVDGSTIEVDVDGRLSLNQLEGFSEDQIDLVRSKLVNAGPSGDELPVKKHLTIDDWESGVLPDNYVEDVDFAEIQNDISLRGNALKLESEEDGSGSRITKATNLETGTQDEDVISWDFYLVGEDSLARFLFNVPNENSFQNAYEFAIRADNGNLEINERPFQAVEREDFDFTNHLEEWLTLEVMRGEDGTLTGTVFDQSGSELVTASGMPEFEYDSGGVSYQTQNTGGNKSIVYVDSNTSKREFKRYVTDTKKGTVELGGETVSPAGAINTGPQEVLDTEGVLADIAVSPDVAQGTPVGGTITLNQDPAFSIKGESDGSGGVQNAKIESNLPFEALEADKADTRSGYEDVSSSRSFDTWELNDTGSDLDVVVVVSPDADGTTTEMLLDVNDSESTNAIDNQRMVLDSTERMSVQATVPNGFNYQVRARGNTSDFSLNNWKEQQ